VIEGGSDTATGIRPGDVLAGKYQVERVLGQGGMGVVVAAHHVQLDTKVAIKFLLPEMLSNWEAVDRFTREARAAVKITSEHVARVLDVGTLESGAPYMVMEFLEGGDLSEWVRQRGALPIEQAIDFVLQASVAVAEAHGLGIVHRDLKPANLFCVRRQDGQSLIKVLDFGISKRVDTPGRISDPPGSVTKTSAIMGSPLYMSPEQMQSAKSANAQSDIWSLGIILYELLAGRVPFSGENFAEIVVNVTMHPPGPLGSYRPDLPPGLEAVVLRCLEKDRSRRYANVAQLAHALLDFAPMRSRTLVERITGTIQAAGLSVSALDKPPSPPEPQSTFVSAGTATAMPVSNTRSPSIPVPSRRAGIFIGVGLATLVVGIGAGVALYAGGRPPAVSSPAAAAVDTTVPAASEGALKPAATTATTSTPVTTTTAAPPPPGGWTTVTADDVPAAPPLRPAAVQAHPPGQGPSPSPPTTPPVSSETPKPPAPPAPPRPSAVAPNCDPPYTLDDQGHKHFKHECFRK
jgi:eukaryotic-like serine/threonine-protein kinase